MITSEVFTDKITPIYRKDGFVIIGDKLPFPQGSVKYQRAPYRDTYRIWIFTMNDVPLMVVSYKHIQKENGEMLSNLTEALEYLNSTFNVPAPGSSTYCGFEDLGDLAGIFNSA